MRANTHAAAVRRPEYRSPCTIEHVATSRFRHGDEPVPRFACAEEMATIARRRTEVRLADRVPGQEYGEPRVAECLRRQRVRGDAVATSAERLATRNDAVNVQWGAADRASDLRRSAVSAVLKCRRSKGARRFAAC